MTIDTELFHQVPEENEEGSRRRTSSMSRLKSLLGVGFRLQPRDRATRSALRAASAGEIAPSSTDNLRVLYTGNSEFYDDCDKVEDNIVFDDPVPLVPIDPKVMEEIELFEKLIRSYFHRK